MLKQTPHTNQTTALIPKRQNSQQGGYTHIKNEEGRFREEELQNGKETQGWGEKKLKIEFNRMENGKNKANQRKSEKNSG